MGYAFNSTLINVWNRLFVLCLLINYSLYCIYVSDKKCIRFFWDRKLIEYFLSGAPGGGGHTGGEDGWQAVPSRPARGTFEKVNIPVPEKDPP